VLNPVDSGLGSSTAIQHEMMHSFAQQGFDHPAQRVTKKGWREQFVKAIICDDLVFQLGEGDGIKDVFMYILPGGYTIPTHQTVRCNLDLLYDQLDRRVNGMIKVSHNLIFSTGWTLTAASGSLL
jgi:hypothetical protein